MLKEQAGLWQWRKERRSIHDARDEPASIVSVAINARHIRHLRAKHSWVTHNNSLEYHSR